MTLVCVVKITMKMVAWENRFLGQHLTLSLCVSLKFLMQARMRQSTAKCRPRHKHSFYSVRCVTRYDVTRYDVTRYRSNTVPQLDSQCMAVTNTPNIACRFFSLYALYRKYF